VVTPAANDFPSVKKFTTRERKKGEKKKEKSAPVIQLKGIHAVDRRHAAPRRAAPRRTVPITAATAITL